MNDVQRKHVSLPLQTVRILEDYQKRHRLGSFSASVEAAALALEQRDLELAYMQFAEDYANDTAGQREAEAWLGVPMDET